MGPSGVGVGLLFDGPEDDDQPKPQESLTQPPVGFGGNKGKGRSRIPNPYEFSSESEGEDEGEPEMALDEVDTVRRSLLRPHPQQQQRRPLSERAKKGWLAHQSVFPPSSSSSSEDDTDKETESESGDGELRFTNGGHQGSYEAGADSSNLYDTRTIPAAYNVATNLEEPLLGEEDGQRESRVPVRLHVYHGRFGHWEKEGLRKYKGQYIDPHKAWD